MKIESVPNAEQAPANEAPPAAEAKPAVNTEAMEAAAKEASMMLFDKILAKEGQDAQAQEQAQAQQPEPKAEAKPEKKPKATKKATEPELEVDEPEPEPEPEKKPLKRSKSVSAEKVAEMAAKSAAEAAAETMRRLEEQRAAREQEAAKKPELEVPEELAKEVEQLKEVQRLYGSKYKGRDLVSELIESTKKEREYERDWRRKNPGQEFDWNDEEHRQYADSIAVEVDEDHLRDAEKSLIKESAIREAEERFSRKYGQDIEAIRRQRAESELAPVRQQVNQAVSKGLLEAVRPDLVEGFDKDPSAVIDEIKNDPIAVEAVTAVERWSIPALDAAVRVLNNPSGYSEKSPEVQALANAALHVDQVLASVPADERPVAEDGRKFASLKDYARIPAARRGNYYTVQDEALITPLIIKVAQYEASTRKTELEKRAEAYAKRMGYTKQESNTSPKPAAKPEPKPAAAPAPSVKAAPAAEPVAATESKDVFGFPPQFWKGVGLKD